MTTELKTRAPKSDADMEAVLAAARGIGPLLRERAAEGEARRRPTEATMEAMRDAGLSACSRRARSAGSRWPRRPVRG
jgi:hypothetical protein